MPNEPKPRTGVYETYWYFAAERLRMMKKRAAGEPGPWTADPILQQYKFCNTFRAADRVSQYLIREVCYSGDASDSDRIFQIVAFRTFSKPETWERLKAALGRAPTIQDLESGLFGKALDSIRAQGHGLYTGAFILCANSAFGFQQKHKNHNALFRSMFVESEIASQIADADSLQDVFEILHAFPLMGDFMSYQTAVDINYSSLTNFSEDDFTRPGPGALRGLKKVFKSLGNFSPEQAIMWMVNRQEEEFERLGYNFPGLWGRRLHAIDCQGLFCETDKYSREAFPSLRSARSRIKARFRRNPAPIPFFFPPKWNLNHKLRTPTRLAANPFDSSESPVKSTGTNASMRAI